MSARQWAQLATLHQAASRNGTPLRIDAQRDIDAACGDAAASLPSNRRPMTANGESVPMAALPAPAAAPVATLAPRLPTGTDPDAVRDWFEFETIVDLPAPAASFAEAEADQDRNDDWRNDPGSNHARPPPSALFGSSNI
ncbi:MAG: hypothetical protein WB760_28040, partial [Xanthobacteraceae bacterium]